MATLAAVASGAVTRPVKRWWLQDTGSGYDLTTQKNLPSWLKHAVTDADEALWIDTANGPIPANKVVPMQIAATRETSPLLP